MADLTIFEDAAWRAVYIWRQRFVRPILDAQIAELEELLIQLRVALPILDSEAGPPKPDGDYRELRDRWGFPRKRRRGRHPIITRRGLAMDVAVEAMRAEFATPEADETEVVAQFVWLLDEYERLRGRGYRYGLLSNGIQANAVSDVAGTPLTRDLVQGKADVCAFSLLRVAEKELVVAVADEDAGEVDFLRLLYAKLAAEGAADGHFRRLLTGPCGDNDLEALDILTGYPFGPLGWFKPFGQPEMPTWRLLSAMALGILDNGPPDPEEARAPWELDRMSCLNY